MSADISAAAAAVTSTSTSTDECREGSGGGDEDAAIAALPQIVAGRVGKQNHYHRRRCPLNPVAWRRRTTGGAAVVLFLLGLLVVQYGYDDGRSTRWYWLLKQGNKENVKLIVLWTPFFELEDYGFGVGRREPFVRAGCRPHAIDCETTIDRSRVSEADALVFHMRNTWPSDVPPRDSSNWHQRYVFFLMESPDNTERDLRTFAGLFNWTMTYRLDSDIVAPYFEVRRRRRRRQQQHRPPPPRDGRVRRQDEHSEHLDLDKDGDKSKAFVAWLVSNCRTDGHREGYVHELRQHLQVDIYGACGSSCHDQCESIVFGDPNNRSNTGYKFYLAFENSVCRDYVTEKLSNALRHGVVPVVYGGADYDRVAPPMSYIDVRRFQSPRHLARHLIDLNRNDSAYAAHLGWRADYEVVTDGQPIVSRALCRLCAKLHENRTRTTAPTKFYADIDNWWSSAGNCTHSTLTVNTKK